MAPFILVALDTSETSFWALDRALLMARARDWTVRAVHVVEKGAASGEPSEVERQLRAQVEERSVAERGDVHIVVRAGSPARILADEAADPGCLVVVVGASDKSFMGAMMLGKTAGQTLASVSKPFLLVHGEPRDAYRRVVAAIDFENHSRDALREAIPLGLVPDNIRLIHAFTLAMARSDPTSIQRKKEEISLQFRDLLREIDLDPSHVGTEMREGPAFTTITNFLDETNADLVILGCHGKGPLTTRTVGSTTMALLQKAAADVLVAGRLFP